MDHVNERPGWIYLTVVAMLPPFFYLAIWPSIQGVYTKFVQSPSTSGESAMPVKKEGYDVFINHFEHRLGPAIYEELTAMGLNVFLNSEDCEDEEVEAALKSAWLYIPIFSGDYAQSSRRLEERSFMHGREDIKIVPIFCDVDTADVRYAKGVYAFDPSSENQECKKELYSVSHYIGPEVNSEEDERMLPKAIAEWVAKEGKKFQEFASASTSSGGSTKPVKEFSYDVFINHRGPDVKRTLAKAIYKKLTDMGLKVFLDSEELGWGDHFPSVLEEVMKSAWLHIAIFSESYADSKWCMRELSFLLRTGARVVPIFYHLNPIDVRYARRGGYATAFDKHEKKGRHAPEKLEEWEEALHNVSNISGIAFNSEDNMDFLVETLAAFAEKLHPTRDKGFNGV